MSLSEAPVALLTHRGAGWGGGNIPGGFGEGGNDGTRPGRGFLRGILDWRRRKEGYILGLVGSKGG